MIANPTLHPPQGGKHTARSFSHANHLSDYCGLSDFRTKKILRTFALPKSGKLKTDSGITLKNTSNTMNISQEKIDNLNSVVNNKHKPQDYPPGG